MTESAIVALVTAVLGFLGGLIKGKRSRKQAEPPKIPTLPADGGPPSTAPPSRPPAATILPSKLR